MLGYGGPRRANGQCLRGFDEAAAWGAMAFVLHGRYTKLANTPEPKASPVLMGGEKYAKLLPDPFGRQTVYSGDFLLDAMRRKAA